MTDTISYILIGPLACLVVLSAFFSGAETAYSSVQYSKIDEDLRAGKKVVRLIEKHYKSFGRTLSTILICNNLVNVLSSALMTMIVSHFISKSTYQMLITTFVMTPIIVAFGEITPKLLAKKYSYGYLKKIAYVMEILNILFFPITFPISKMTLSAKVTNTENELKTIIGLAAREGVLEKREATLAQNALDLDSKKIAEILTPKDNIISLPKGASIGMAKKVFQESGHSRIPIIDNDKFVGAIFLKDIVFKKGGTIDEKIIDLPRISKYKIVTKALEQLRKEKIHMAFVKNPSNNEIVGLITLEDILEELIGEIYDEHDKVSGVRQVGLHRFIAKGSATMELLEKEINYSFESSEELTVKQWIQSRITRNIKTGLIYKYKDEIKFKIISNKNGEETIIEITLK